MRTRRPRELLTATAIARRLDRPRSTVTGWIDRGDLIRAGIDPDGRDVYDLTVARALDQSTPTRRRGRP